MSPAKVLSLLAVAGLAVAPAARAQPPPSLASIRQSYEFGKLEETTRLAQAALEAERQKKQPDPQLLIELHKYAAVSFFSVSKSQDAERHFLALLQLDPDYTLDPFVFPPPAVAALEKLKQENVKILDAIREVKRQQRQREAEEREAAEREAKRREQEEQRRRLESISRPATLRVERHSFLTNFIPFGAGQFQQGRTSVGVVLASTEAALAATSMVAYLAINGLIAEEKRTIEVVGNHNQEVTIRRIPPERMPEATTWRWVKNLSTGGFYGVYLIGVADALYHHRDEVVIEGTPSPGAPRTAGVGGGLHLLDGPALRGQAAWSGPALTAPRPFFFPVPGGLGAGLLAQF